MQHVSIVAWGHMNDLQFFLEMIQEVSKDSIVIIFCNRTIYFHHAKASMNIVSIIIYGQYQLESVAKISNLKCIDMLQYIEALRIDMLQSINTLQITYFCDGLIYIILSRFCATKKKV